MKRFMLKKSLVFGSRFLPGLSRNVPKFTGVWGLEPPSSQALENNPGQAYGFQEVIGDAGA